MTITTKALHAHLGRRELLQGVDLSFDGPKLVGIMSLDGDGAHALLSAIHHQLGPASAYLKMRDRSPQTHDELLRLALAQSPRCILIDESLFIHDKERQSQWMTALRQLPVSTFIALREPGAAKECDWLYIIEYGRIQRQGRPTL